MTRWGALLSGSLVVTGVAAPAGAQSFGNAVSVGDGEIFVGEPTQELRSGVVYVFRPDASGAWVEAQRLEPAEPQAGDRFGIRIATGGDELLVSATRADGGTGAVYLFRKQGGAWTQSGRLTTDDRSPADSLGSGLAIDGDWVMVGTIGQGGGRGAVYAFRRDGDGWRQHSKIAPADLAAGDRFGSTVALHGDWAFVSAPQKDDSQGAVYTFQYDGAGDRWQPRGRLDAVAAQPQMAFGSDLELGDDVALVSAPGFLGGTGAVFAYLPGDDGWEINSILSPYLLEPGGQFGASISFDGASAWIGAPSAAGGAGRVYAFSRNADGEWVESQGLTPEGATARQAFAATVAVGGDVAVAAALRAEYGAGDAYVYRRSDSGWGVDGKIEGDLLGAAAVTGDEVECSEDSTAAEFGCSSVDLLSFLPLRDMGAGRGVVTNDIWGWTEPETGREIAIVGMTDQTAFVDVTNPTRPVYLGRLPLHEGAHGSSWRDMKTYKNFVYVVSDGAGPHGMQIFDLTHLRGLDGSDPQTFREDAHYDRINSAHNIVIDEETGFAYAVGSSEGGETCGGGLHMIDLHDPEAPTFAGCFQDMTTGRQRTGYTHDAQCLVYRGPDTEHQGAEICLGSNETAFSIADVTDKANPKALATASYPNVGYSHQGWISQDQKYFFMDDELDEIGGQVQNTRTLVWDITDLDDPVLVKEHFSDNRSTDHNLYVVGNTMYQSNYVSGLRVLDVSDPENPVNVGFFDTVPYGQDEPGFEGSWSNYPFFKSGVVILTSGQEGLFVVRYRARSVS